MQECTQSQLDQSSHAQRWKRMMPLHKLQEYRLQSGLGQMSKENKKRKPKHECKSVSDPSVVDPDLSTSTRRVLAWQQER